ncbi:MAG TPA: cytochrome b [Burkholderiaceae bacterium]|nr:cytochrome b [Burkholderiaceae bacterium]
MNATSAQRYTNTAITLHWLIALLIFVGFSIGWIMTDIPGLTPTKLRYYSWHKWTGITIFMFVLIRVVWRLTHRPPPLPPMARWQRIAATSTHAALYVLMIVIPLAGYLYSYAAGVPVVYFGLIELPPLITPNPAHKDIYKYTHIGLNFTMAALVIGHIVAALGHQIVQRDGLLLRMLPRRAKATSTEIQGCEHRE